MWRLQCNPDSWLSTLPSTVLFALSESCTVDFLSNCWIIEQSYHRTSRPSICSTIRVVVVLMGPSISPREDQGNTCINKNTHTRTHPLAHTSAVTRLLFGGGPSWELVVFQQWSEHVRKCAYTMATHAGSTVLRSVAVLQHLGRLQIKHTITYMEPCGDKMCEGCNWALKTLAFLIPFCLCMHVRLQPFISVCQESFPSWWAMTGRL